MSNDLPPSEDLPLREGAGSKERFVLNDLPSSEDLPLSEGAGSKERPPKLERIPEFPLSPLPEAFMDVPLSRAALFLRMFSAPRLLSVLVNRVVLKDLPEREISSAVLLFLVTGSIVVTLFEFLSAIRFEMSFVPRPDLSETTSPRSRHPS
jgi:hypothetical protein